MEFAERYELGELMGTGAFGAVRAARDRTTVLPHPDDQPVITDLGLARDVGATVRTNTGELLGTPRFMAPEQVFGGPISPATDVRAMGVVIYEVFTCRFDLAAARRALARWQRAGRDAPGQPLPERLFAPR